MKKIISIMLIVVPIFISGCTAKGGNENLAKMEKPTLEKNIVKGKTTKVDIKKMFGDPESVSLSNNDEEWEYSYNKVTASATNFIPIVNLFTAGTSSDRKALVILFNKKGIVKNYTVTQTKNEAKAGLF